MSVDDSKTNKEDTDFFDDDFFDRWDFEQDIYGLSPPPEEVIGTSPKRERRHIYDMYVPNWRWGQVDLSRWDRSSQINVLRYRVSGNIQHQQIDLEDEYGPIFLEAIERTASRLKSWTRTSSTGRPIQANWPAPSFESRFNQFFGFRGYRHDPPTVAKA